MFVACSTLCFANDPLESALVQMADLEYARAEIAILTDGKQLKPAEVVANPEQALHRIRNGSPVTPVAFNLDIQAEGEQYLKEFHAVCRLAKQALTTSVTIQASEVGTPFNTEVDRLRELVSIASSETVLLSVETHVGRLTEDPDTAAELCRAVPGLGITLDPSHYICGPHQGKSYSQVIPHVYHVHLRDTSREKMQVCVGQGEIEYGKIAGYLERYNYKRALSVEIIDKPDNPFDRNTELRKLRLMLETLV